MNVGENDNPYRLVEDRTDKDLFDPTPMLGLVSPIHGARPRGALGGHL